MNADERTAAKNAPLSLDKDREEFVNWAASEPDGCISAGSQQVHPRLCDGVLERFPRPSGPLAATDTSGLLDAIRAVDRFSGGDLTRQIGQLELALKGCDQGRSRAVGFDAGVTSQLLAAAYSLKRAAGQVHVVIHAVAISLLVPKIIEQGERVEYVSLGAGNTGREFDLETDRRVAEFKFIHWRGGSETIRQNAIFKDFYRLAEFSTSKRRELFVLDTKYPLQFLEGGRSIESVCSRKLLHDFRAATEPNSRR